MGISGFFRDPGPQHKFSMVRLVAFLLSLDATAITGATVYYTIRCGPQATVLSSVALILGALVASGAVALLNRTVPQDTTHTTPETTP